MPKPGKMLRPAWSNSPAITLNPAAMAAQEKEDHQRRHYDGRPSSTEKASSPTLPSGTKQWRPRWPGRRHRPPDRPALAGHPLHAPPVSGKGHGPHASAPWPRPPESRSRSCTSSFPRARPTWPPDRRDPQAPRLHLTPHQPRPCLIRTIQKVSIIVSHGSLEGIYPGLIMANGARAEGIEADLFFTFFGLDAINKQRHEHIKGPRGRPGPAHGHRRRRPAGIPA